MHISARRWNLMMVIAQSGQQSQSDNMRRIGMELPIAAMLFNDSAAIYRNRLRLFLYDVIVVQYDYHKVPAPGLYHYNPSTMIIMLLFRI